MQERKRDYYYKKAKREKYRSRAAYKLLEAIEKYGFIRDGDVVIDLGAAPGGWMQAARKTVGENGYVLGIDFKSIEPFPEENVRQLEGDITDAETLRQINDLVPRRPDVVISDLSPSISGAWEVDHARQIDLAEQALSIATCILKPCGNFFTKVFQGDMLDDFVARVKSGAKTVRVIKPKASRSKSSEMFVLALCLDKGSQHQS